MKVWSREAKRHSQLNKPPRIPSPPPLPRPCVYVQRGCVCVSVRPYILNHVTQHEQSCTQCEKPRYI